MGCISKQDNAIALTTDGGQNWPGASQGDSGFTAVDPFKPNIVYSEWPQGGFARNENGGAGRIGSGAWNVSALPVEGWRTVSRAA